MSEKTFEILSDGHRNVYAHLYNFPNECPYCHKHIIPGFLSHYKDRESNLIYATLLCSNAQCDMPFIAKYQGGYGIDYYYEHLLHYSVSAESFSNEINEVSPKFQEIFNQAFFAEQEKLLEICGVGYRKALEFLIKDYLIKLHPEKENTIKKNNISNCINTYVQEFRLKSTASRAIWLGNDHTHYEKKWTDKDLDDLKILIKLTVNWIESEILTNRFNDSMQK